MPAEPAPAILDIILPDEQAFPLDKDFTTTRAVGIGISMTGNIAYVYIVQARFFSNSVCPLQDRDGRR